MAANDKLAKITELYFSESNYWWAKAACHAWPPEKFSTALATFINKTLAYQ